ncbi:AvrD family protein [Arthrobacter sp. StoSoilB5]|jgi:hypothetical protein|uniref:AvrD family protein n=1 Tax=Arthrobacter sp. StoSoilB5 TaxID=2830992 RepID=UPI001CC4EEF0|nr:AvrD family protein [Arthrobacter sp. StoSoilB5]
MDTSVRNVIDDVLGPADERYFGSGFRRVAHCIEDLKLEMASQTSLGVTGVAALSYPRDWSRKDHHRGLRPHLSTVDAFVIAVELAEVLLIRVFSLGSRERTSAWIRSVEFRSGAVPQEKLEAIDVKAALVATKPSSRCLSAPFESLLECSVGSIKVQLRLEHEICSFNPKMGPMPSLSSVLGEAEGRFYGEGFRHRFHKIGNVRFTADNQRVDASVAISSASESAFRNDIGGDYRPSVSILDCVIAQSQMTQALLYQVDGISRHESNTLWMRRVVIAADTPYRPLSHAFDASSTVEKSRLLNVNGRFYRSTDFSGTFLGLVNRYSLAHELPDRVLTQMGDPELQTTHEGTL